MLSVQDVAEVTVVHGSSAPDNCTPSLLIELPHGATRTEHYTRTFSALRGGFPEQLEHFFYVNTDIGSPELGHEVARQYLAAHPDHAVVLVCSQIPRTFVDCNRVISPSQAALPAGVTPGLPPYVRHPEDQALLTARHAAYQQVVDHWWHRVTEQHGLVLMLHTYAPRAVGVSVDDNIVQSLHAAYAPSVVEQWPLRPPIDVICKDMDGQLQVNPSLLSAIVDAYGAGGLHVGRGDTYPLHPATTAAHRALKCPGRTICIEFRRDLLVRSFTPFAEMIPDDQRVERLAAPLADVLASFAQG